MNLRKNLHRYINLYNYIEAYRSNTLPNGYTRLDYIESTGTQHIDTGVGLDAVNKVTGKVTFLSKPTLAYIAGARGVNGRAIGYALYSSVHDGFTIYNSLWPNQGVDISTGQILEFETVMKNAQQSFVVDGDNVLNNNVQISDFINSNQITLFSLGSNEYLAEARIYAIKFYKDSSLVADFIPASHVENSVTVVGMYDMVSGTFFTNAGTGEFIAGPESSDNSSNDSLVLQDAIKDSLKSLKAYGKTELKPDTLLDTVVANGGTEILSHDYMDSITAKGKTEQHKLPVGYQELEYIESTGTQWIDTGIKDIVNSEFEITAQQTAISGNFPTIVGALDGDTSPATDYKVIVGLSTTDNKYYTQTGGSTGFHVSSIPNDINKHKFNVKVGTNQTILTIDDTNVYPGNYTVTTTQKYSLFICARNKSTVSNFTQQKVFGFTARKNDTLISNLVPARNASGVVGMYDTVSCTFFTNSGTGSFIAGPLVNLPEEYERIEYIESTGTQAINTGVKYSGNNFVVEWEAKDNNTSNDSTLFAATKNTPYSGGLYGNKSSRKYYLGTGSGQEINYTSNDSQYHKWKLTMSGQTATLYKDNVQVGTASMTGTIDTTHDIYLFCGGLLNDSGSDLTQFASWSLKSWKLTDNGVVKFDAIPVKNSQDTRGLFDMVSGNFLTNAGSGTFKAGPSLKVPSDYTVLDYIESTGTQYINTGYKSSNSTKVKAQISCPNVGTFIFGSRNEISGTAQKRFGLFFNTTWNPQYANENGTGSSTSVDTIYDIEMSQNGFYVNGNLNTSFASATFSGDYNMYLFANNTADTTIGYGSCKIYSFEIYTNNVLVRNLVPVRHNSDGVIGMYDTVSGTLLTNQGTGTFKAGYKVNILPDNPVNIYCNNGTLKVNLNLYWAEYHGYELSQVDGITTKENGGVNVSGMVDCRTIKSFKITTISPQGAFCVFKYRADNTFINASSTANIGDIVTLEDNVGFFRVQYNFTSGGVDTENILIYNSVCDLGEIYTNGTNEIVSKHSKNLYNYKTAIDAYLTDTGGLTPSIQGKTSVLINVKPFTTYTLKFLRTAAEIYTRVCSYDSNEEFISLLVKDTDVTAGYKTNTFTTDANAKYIKVSFKADSTEVQLEENSTATTYEPYRCENATCEKLLSVGSHIDTQDILTGNISRNINILVLKGTENWAAGATGRYYLNITPAYVKAQYTPLCSHFQMYTESGGTGDMTVPNMLALYVGSVDAYQLYAYPNSTVGATVNTWKAWLAQQYAAGTPVMIIYPLATATSEIVSKQINNKETGDTIEVIAGSLEDLEVTNTSSTHTIPLPDYPLDINCNNGVLKVSKNLYNSATRVNGYYIGADGVIAQGSGTYCYSALIPVKPNTDYILSGIAGQSDIRRLHAYDSNGNWISQISFANMATGNTYNITGTTPNNCAYVRISIPKLDTNTQVEQGSIATTYHSYGIYTDGIVETLIAYSSDNLYTSTIPVINAYVNANNGTLTAGNPGSSTQYSFVIPCKSNTTYKLDGMTALSGWGSFTNNTIGTVATTFTKGNDTLTTGPNDQYLIGMVYATGTLYDYRNTLDIREGSNIATCEDLLSVGTYIDTQDVISGTVTRNVGVYVCDGTEDWEAGTGQWIGNCYCDDLLPNLKRPTTGKSPAICTAFPMVENLSDFSVGEGYVSSNPVGRVNLWYNDTVDNFKQYLAEQYAAGTPVIIVYPLATATTETVDKQRMRKGTVSITEASMTGLTVNTTESVHTIPSPDFPLDLYCNNGKLKENTSTSGVNEIVATDIVDGYLNCTVGQAPVINSSTASQIIKHALRVKAGKSYKFSYISSLAGNRESDVIGDDGLAKEKVTLICSVGLNEYTITPNNSGELWLTIQSGDLVSVNPICYEIGKVAGSGTPEVLTITGKNWFDSSVFNTNVGETITPVQFQIPNGTYLMTTDFPPQVNTVYTNVWIIAGKQTSGWDSAVNGVSKGNPKTVTITDGWCTVAYRSSIPAIPNNPKDYRWQLEEGTRPTQYEDYMNINCSVEDLLSAGDYQDIEDLKAGITNRKVGIKVLDGTENWVTTGDQKNIIIQNATNLWNVMAGVGGYCTHLTVLKSGEETFAGACRFAMDFNVYEYKTAFGVNNITEFKQFLADQYALGTPVIIVYPLATETTESTITQNVDIVSGTNTIERNSEYFNSLGTEVNYKKLR